MTYDVAVVGAGPAGALAALRLARAGAGVLLLEKQALGRDKPCGGGLTARAWLGLEVGIDDLVVATPGVAELRFGARRAVRIDLGRRPVVMIRRCDFDRRLALAAAEAGAELHDREPVTALCVEGGAVRIASASSSYHARLVLLATGAEAPLRSSLGLRPAAAVMAAAIEVEAEAEAPSLAPGTFVFDYSVPGGYAWAFPKGPMWNVGVLSTRREVTPRLRRHLADFVEGAGIRFAGGTGPVARAAGRRIPFHGGRRPLTSGPVALIGDAAGLADPFFGEGIAQALASGRLAAGCALEVLAGGRADLSGYPAVLHRALRAHLRRMSWMSRAVYPRPATAVRMLAVPPARVMARRAATLPLPRLPAMSDGVATGAPTTAHTG